MLPTGEQMCEQKPRQCNGVLRGAYPSISLCKAERAGWSSVELLIQTDNPGSNHD
ncbi:hypothetical protein PTKU46_81670 [Paraburkholderia terrae]